MAIETISGVGTVITGADIKNVFRPLALKGTLKLEIVGLKGRGRTAYSIIKEEYDLKGSKASVLAQFETILRQTGVLQP